MRTNRATGRTRKSISITLSPDLIAKIDRALKPGRTRSRFIESVLLDHFNRIAREKIDRRDLRLINENIEYLTREAEDVERFCARLYVARKKR